MKVTPLLRISIVRYILRTVPLQVSIRFAISGLPRCSTMGGRVWLSRVFGRKSSATRLRPLLPTIDSSRSAFCSELSPSAVQSCQRFTSDFGIRGSHFVRYNRLGASL